MRHGGTRNVYNEVPDLELPDLELAKQLLGNSTLHATTVYAKRRATALTEFAEKQWLKVVPKPDEESEGGCNWLQIAAAPESA